MTDHEAYIAFNMVPNIGAVKVAALAEKHGSVAAAWEAFGKKTDWEGKPVDWRAEMARARKMHVTLVTCDDSETARERADIMCSTSDGFVIAEKDLEIRGPGEFFGFRQHGLPQLRMADPLKHREVADRAREDVRKLLEEDPRLA